MKQNKQYKIKNKILKDISTQDSLFLLADRLVMGAKKIIHPTKVTEEDLRIGFEKILEPILKKLGIKSTPKYEKSIYNAGRSDALHGQVVIEYERPFAFKSSRSVKHAYKQLVRYIQNLSDMEKKALFLFDVKFIGVGFDGEKIFFVRYKGDKQQAKAELRTEDFILDGLYDFNEQSARTLLTHLRALARPPLTAENLADKFGPKSELAPRAVSAFANSLEYWGDQTRVRTFFNEWKRLFGIVYGEQFSGHQAEEAQALASLYKVSKETDFQELLFSVHTYFAFLMKIIAAELLTLKESTFSSSLASELAHVSEKNLKRQLKDIENGGIYAKKGITNFLEGDFFRWYLDAWSPQLKDAIQEITRALSEFEPATSILNPSATRDLLKKLYQYLVPQQVRHRLGEYYTPDWLAELVLNEVDYDGNTLKRLLDPACGSGTFLVLAIQRAKEYGKKEKLPPFEIAKRIKENIWGFDLNPLAVIAARTNYLFAMGDLINELPDIEIPIYLTDSVLSPAGTREELFEELYIERVTSAETFRVPKCWVNENFLMKKVAPLFERMVKNNYLFKEVKKRLKKESLFFPDYEKTISQFYNQLLQLEKKRKNGIWARFLKNDFAPITAGKFDFVVGNPPWIRWSYLSEEYRHATLNLWKEYGLFSLKGHAARLGGGEKDFSMLFVYASSDYYLHDGAILGFLITQEVFKSKGAGEGFRKFQLGNKKHLKVLKAHDLVSVQPFEGVANKTAVIILKKGETTKYPIPYIVWTRKKGIGKVATDKLLDEALFFLQRENLIAQPMDVITSSWQTISEKKKNLAGIKGENFYQARQGADPQPYGVFLLKILDRLSNGNILIENLSNAGKFKTHKVKKRIESDLVFPAVRGSDIKRWSAVAEIYILMSQDPYKREPYPEWQMKDKWPYTFDYFVEFKNFLLARSSKSIRDLMKRTAFYAMFGIGPYTVSRYKVVWKLMSNDIFASVVSQCKTILGYKIVIPTKTVAMFATDNEREAHYLCAVINSNPVREFIKSFSSAGRGFGTPSVMQYLGISKFDSQHKLHQKLSEISQKCHQLKPKGKEKEITVLEKENNDLVKKLFKMCKSGKSLKK